MAMDIEGLLMGDSWPYWLEILLTTNLQKYGYVDFLGCCNTHHFGN
jgi:hypothetical protein